MKKSQVYLIIIHQSLSVTSKNNNILSTGTSEATQPQCGKGDCTEKDHAGGFRSVPLPLSQQTLSML